MTAEPGVRVPSAISCAVVGYGAAFNQGRSHARQITETPGLDLVAICDVVAERAAAAEADFPGVRGFTDLGRLLAEVEPGLVAVVVPHHLHASTAIQCLQAGAHVVVEKPMAITVAECDAMIAAARAAARVLTVYHNRRWDGDFLTARGLIRDGVVGDVFQIEYYSGGYGRPGGGWRSDKAVSGGAFYDWGAHSVDWVLGLMDAPLRSVTGFFHKRLWHDVTNEDQVQAVLRFADNRVADVQQSHLSLGPKPRWRILGTRGAILDLGQRTGGQSRPCFSVRVPVSGYTAEFQVPFQEPLRDRFYPALVDHITGGRPLQVTAESARRVIAVLEGAERSAAGGQAVAIPYEEEFEHPHAR